jgi:hypothetical protein
MPESLVGALEGLGHEVDSVNHLKLKGLDNGTLYRQVAIGYDLCFTRDSAFAHKRAPDARPVPSQSSPCDRAPTESRVFRSSVC